MEKSPAGLLERGQQRRIDEFWQDLIRYKKRSAPIHASNELGVQQEKCPVVRFERCSQGLGICRVVS